MSIYSVTVNRVIVLLVSLSFLNCCDSGARGRLKPGDTFPVSSLSELMGGEVVAQIAGKTLVVNFWASWCPPCRKEMPALQGLDDAMNRQHFRVIGVSVDEDKNLMREFLIQHQIHFDNYHDAERQLAYETLGIRNYPETFIISPEGLIIMRIVGEQPWNSEAVHSLLERIHKGDQYPLKSLGPG
ncbi:MAG: TlpA family protein disulfide reductase [Gammaproteobacteria bacterium]|nr:TlpA family protein disulfide reductase [Gammaproteobacteria bacterium]